MKSYPVTTLMAITCLESFIRLIREGKLIANIPPLESPNSVKVAGELTQVVTDAETIIERFGTESANQ